MKNSYVLIGIVAFLLLFGGCKYNSMITADQAVGGKWADVETQYQRRVDLISNLVETVKGEKDFEKSLLVEVTQARANATSIKVDASDLSPEKIQQVQAAQGQLSTAIGRLLAVSENYPTLKANESFRNLQVEIAGTENRVAVARKDFNAAVLTYNTSVSTFPNNLFAGAFGFKQKGFFKADAGAEKAPQVKF